MTRPILIAALVGALAAPATALAGPQPSQTDRTNAAKECKAERGTTDATREAFAARYGTNASKSNAYGKCVSSRSRDEHAERHAARSKASKQCKAERGTTAESKAAFAAKYRNFGACVSRKAKANEKAADARDAEKAEARQNAAEQCDEERGETAASKAAFNARYGTNKNDRNAFGKCVSAKAKAQNEYAPAQP